MAGRDDRPRGPDRRSDARTARWTAFSRQDDQKLHFRARLRNGREAQEAGAPPEHPQRRSGDHRMSPARWHRGTRTGASSSATGMGAPEGWWEHGCETGARAPAHADPGDHRSRLDWLPATVRHQSFGDSSAQPWRPARQPTRSLTARSSTPSRDTCPFDMRSDRWLSSPRRSRTCRRQT